MKKQPNLKQLRAEKGVSLVPPLPNTSGMIKAVLTFLLCLGLLPLLQAQVYTAMLSGSNEAPPNSSPGTGTVTVTINNTLNTMRVQCSFSGLTGTTSAAHMHAPTAVAGVGNVGVATTTPTFAGFPLGVTSGSYDMTLDMTMSGSYNPSYMATNGGTPASAFAALKTAIAAGKSYFNVHTSTFGGGEIRGFLRAAAASTLYGYDQTNSRLFSFTAADPGTLLTNVALTGLATNEHLVGIDYRPADGKLYSIAVTTANVGRVVTVNRTTGAVASVSATTFPLTYAQSYGFDFNPVVDRIRLIGEDDVNQRYNPNNGALVLTDSPIAFDPAGPNAGQNIAIVDAAYTKNVPGTPNSTLFAIDFGQDLLVRIGGTNGTPTPNLGVATTIGSLGVVTAKAGGFDIEPVTNIAYAALMVSGIYKLYTIDTATGAATVIGNIGGGGVTIDGLTSVPASTPVCSPVVYAYNATGNRLVSFNSVAPGILLSDIALTGLASGERLLGIDYRPADGLFYSIAVNTGNVGRVVRINVTTGSVEAVGTITHTVNNAVSYSLDFNPVPDRIRLFGTDGTSRRFNPNDGTLSGTDTNPAYVTGDPNFGTPIELTQAAYTKSVAGTPNSTLFAIDGTKNLLVRIGGINGNPNPNLGGATTIGGLTVTATSMGGFDFEPTVNTAFAALTVGGASRFYTIDTLTGAATLVGNIGNGTLTIDGMSVLPCSAPVCAAPVNRLFVDANVPMSGSGSSWTCAIKELSDAITIANNTPGINTILVADGVYKPVTPAQGRYSRFNITRANLRILGGFAGGEANAVDAKPAANPTILSGDIGIVGDASDNAYQIIRIPALAANQAALTIDGFIVENGNANGSGDANGGSGLFSYSLPSTTPVNVLRTTFRNNASAGAGAIQLISASIKFDSCRFMMNSAVGDAGVVYSVYSSPTFANSLFINNSATASGGAFYGNYGDVVFNKTVFSGNTAANGGAVYQNRTNVTYNNSVFNANAATGSAGAIYAQNNCTATISNSTFFKNNANANGGAVALSNGANTVTANSIFFKNTVNGTQTPFADFINYTEGSNVYANNILQARTAVPADNGTNIRNNWRGVDPQFVNEASVLGSDAMWSTTDDGLALGNSSPAKNTGDNALAPSGTDITNSPRIVCPTVDMGAYENQAACATIAQQEFVSIAKVASANGIVANPFNNDLQIRYMGAEKAGINVISASGKMMWTGGNAAKGITHVDASAWSTGMYEVIITTQSGKRMNFKVVKM